MGDHNFPPDLAITPLHIQGQLDAQQQSDWIQEYGIAGRTWEAAPYLASYLQPSTRTSPFTYDPPCSLFTDPHRQYRVIELGSGNGFLGNVIAARLPSSSRLVLTDLEEVVPLLQANLVNIDGTAVLPLAWGDVTAAESALQYMRHFKHLDNAEIDNLKRSEEPVFSHIICSDLVYFPHLLDPLLRTLLLLTNDEQGHQTEVIISYKVRSLAKETAFWEAFGVYFEFAAVDVRCRDAAKSGCRLADNSADDDDRIFVFLAKRRKGTSFAALGHDVANIIQASNSKRDTTFEEILMRQAMSGYIDTM